MKDKKELLQYVMNQFDLEKEDFVWSEKCINPTEGFHKGKDNTQVSNTGLGYYVFTTEASIKLLERRKL